ncbi:hypothetical protein ACWDCB_33415 [Streptomyces sp. NPDC001178]
MERLGLVAVLVALAVASGCSSPAPDDKAAPPSPSSSASADGAREAVEAYVTALNSRSATDLMAVGGVTDAKWSKQEATQILADRGGRGWKIKEVQIEHDMGPDTGSARLVAEDKAGKPLQDTFTVTRQQGTWHVVVFTHQPTGPGKEPASTDKHGS